MNLKLFIALFFVGINLVTAQIEVDNGGLIISIKDVKKASSLNQNLTSIADGNKKAIVKLSFKNKTKELIDVNAISLVDTIYKKRYRAIDIAIGNPISYSDGLLLKPEDIRISTTSLRIKYIPELKDVFEDYSIEGYTNVQYRTRVNRKDKKGIQLYLKPIHRKIKRVKIYFSIPEEMKYFDIYYKDQKLSSANIK